MESTNKQLRALNGRYKVDPNMNINPLSMKLGGIIDAAVMGGVSKYEKVNDVMMELTQTRRRLDNVIMLLLSSFCFLHSLK